MERSSVDYGIIFNMKKAKKERKPVFGTGWVTTDEDERGIRKLRAQTERMSVRFNGSKEIAPFGEYEVTSDEGRLRKTYRVVIAPSSPPAPHPDASRPTQKFPESLACPFEVRCGIMSMSCG